MPVVGNILDIAPVAGLIDTGVVQYEKPSSGKGVKKAVDSIDGAFYLFVEKVL